MTSNTEIRKKVGWSDGCLFVCASGNVCIVRSFGDMRVRTKHSQVTILNKAHHTHGNFPLFTACSEFFQLELTLGCEIPRHLIILVHIQLCSL